jgi:flagellar biosynthesis protein FlhA
VKGLQLFFGKHSDIALVAMVMGVLIVLFAPIPSSLLDFLILSNFSFAFLILLLTFYMARPVEFSTFPSLLLIATLFRLSLNVAATRLILSDANAGKVIGAIGAYVVGGNYVIGLIVFLMMMMPPTTIALPIKLLMFILVDGWAILLKALVGSFH